MPIIITIIERKTVQHEKDVAGEYTVIETNADGSKKHGYAPTRRMLVKETSETKLYEQTVETLNLVNVIAAINEMDLV